MIQSFRDERARRLLIGERVPGLGVIEEAARGRLLRLNAAASVRDLAAIRGNNLEPLKRDRAGQFSIRINDQFRICFTWEQKGPSNVEIVDYH